MPDRSLSNLKKLTFLFSCLMLIGVSMPASYQSVTCEDQGGDSCAENFRDYCEHFPGQTELFAVKTSCKKMCGFCTPCPPNSTESSCRANTVCQQQTNASSYNCLCKSGFSGGLNCTDINECTTGQHQCSVNAECTNTKGSYTCQCKFGYFGNGTTCDDGSNRIVCNETSMAIYFDNRTKLYDGSSITLKDTSCTAKKYLPNNEYGLVTAYDKCGTNTTETLTHIFYENEVTWTFGNTSSAVVRSTGKKIKFNCLLDRSKNTSTIRLEPVKTFTTATEVGFGTFTVSLAMYKDSTFTVLQSIFPAAVKFDQRLYFEVQVGTNDTNLILLIEKCSATPTTDRNHASNYDLIKDRCASDTTVQFISVKQPYKTRFSFMSFKFHGYTQVYLHCQIFMCHKHSSNSRCTSGCQGNNIRRVRRSVSFESEEIGLRSLRRRDNEELEVKNYPPSKIYSLNIGPFVRREDAITDSGNQGDVKSSFTLANGLTLLSAILAVTLGFFVTKAIVKRRAGQKQHGFEKKQEYLNQVF